MKILVINGPNMNLLGRREPEIYGRITYDELLEKIRDWAGELNMAVDFFQSNHEGALVDAIQEAFGKYDGILINPAAYTHTSIAILDALKAVGLPAVEVHLTNPGIREPFRHISYAGLACEISFVGLGPEGYRQGLEYLRKRLL
ncbi:MAG: type II 3-dehydroquinate dehydratase [Lachnospiraceae bacterium]|nr:type II 3-dehydroquinate dehydratase [Lachnospiraceae bacterium]